MKLLHVIGSMNPRIGGPCQGIRNINKESEKLGIFREIVCLDDPSSDYLGNDSFPVYPLGPAKGPWQYSAKLIPWLEENIHRYDAVMLNGLWIYISFALFNVLSKLKKANPDHAIKFFIMPHGMLDPWFQKASGRRLKAIRNWFYWHLIEHKVVNSADAILFTCETELELARTSFSGYYPKKEINVGYGVLDPPAYSEEMRIAFSEICPEVADKPYLLFLSRIHPKKGVDILLKAYASIQDSELKAKLPPLVIAGPGLDSSYGKQIQSLVASTASLKKSVFFTDMIRGDAKWGCIYGCEAFILPSHQENFGIAVAEALSCSKPVLISDQINIYKEIKVAKAGVINSDTFKGTTESLREWLLMTDLQKQTMSQNARQAFLNYFSIKPVVQRLYNVLTAPLT